MLLVTLMLALSLALAACGGGKISGSGTVNYSNGKVETFGVKYQVDSSTLRLTIGD